jgi:hypothetical protein
VFYKVAIFLMFQKKIVFTYYVEKDLKKERKPFGVQLTNYLNELKSSR